MSDLPEDFVAASHTILFDEDIADRCEVCAKLLDGEQPEDDDSYAVPGHGLLVWTRGDERRTFEPPLCSSCAAAIGVSALHRWEIEEEEG